MSKILISWGMVLCYVILNSAGALLIKHKLIQMGEVQLDQFSTFFRYFIKLFSSMEVLIGLAAIFASAIAWMIALSKLDLTIAYPIAIGFNFLVIVVLSVLINGEQLTMNKIYGILLMILALFFIGKG